MLGSAQAESLKPPHSMPLTCIKAWHPQNQEWMPLAAEVVNSNGEFGPEIYFGHTIAKDLPMDDLRLVKYAAGGTALYDDWSPALKGAQYIYFMHRAKTVLASLDAEGVDYELSAMLWLQGESDAHENQADSYEKNLSEFIAHMRSEFKTPAMPFIIARVRNYYGGDTGQAKIVRDAQVKIAESTENVTWFDTDDCSMLNAGHYDATGLAVIGERFAHAYVAGEKTLKDNATIKATFNLNHTYIQ